MQWLGWERSVRGTREKQAALAGPPTDGAARIFFILAFAPAPMARPEVPDYGSFFPHQARLL